jgi:hypothetical protein
VLNSVPRHEDVWGSGGIAPRILETWAMNGGENRDGILEKINFLTSFSKTEEPSLLGKERKLTNNEISDLQ